MLLPRREIATNYNKNSLCNTRISTSIDVFDQPGGSIVNSSVYKNGLVKSIDGSFNGIQNTLDNTLPNNTCEDQGTCLAFVSPSESAKRRVRSSGMIKRQFDISKGNDKTYFVDKAQYLISRNRTFNQNQYNYIRSGSATVQPGDALSSQNLYSTQGLSHCKRYKLDFDCSFSYQWIMPGASPFQNQGNGSNPVTNEPYLFQVDVSAGYYTLDDVNSKLHLTMMKNGHFFLDRASQAKVFTIYFAYNISHDKIELHTSKIDAIIFSPNDVTKPYLPGWDPTVYPPAFNIQNLVQWPVPAGNNGDSIVPVVKILNNGFAAAIGFSPGYYPSKVIPTWTNRTTPSYGFLQDLTKIDNVFISQYSPGIQPIYTKVVYKPSNPQFATQGGVSASSATQRIRYNTITNNAVLYNAAYGLSVANALSYGVPENGYTIKDKIGYPLRRTPKFPPLSTVMRCATCNTWDTQNSTQAN
jgi:hypothetical protein